MPEGEEMSHSIYLASEWGKEERVHWTGKNFRFDHDWQVPGIVIGADDLMHEIAMSKGDQFRVEKVRGRGVIRYSKLAAKVMDCVVSLDPYLVRRYLPRHRFSPYFEIWDKRHREFMDLPGGLGHPESLDVLNKWFNELRSELASSPFQKQVRNQRRAAHKNARSVQRYFDALFRDHAKLLSIRVDLGYRRQPEEETTPWVPPADSLVKTHLEKLLRYVRRKVPHLLGIIWKLEYGAMKGHHIHAMFICDGHRVREGITWGRIIGDEWERVTQGAGSAWNCNADQDLFEKLGRRGIGLISYDDKLRRDNLLKVGLYMVKADTYVRFLSPDIGRTFGKSIHIDKKKGNGGRPRKYEDAVEGKKAG